MSRDRNLNSFKCYSIKSHLVAHVSKLAKSLLKYFRIFPLNLLPNSTKSNGKNELQKGKKYKSRGKEKDETSIWIKVTYDEYSCARSTENAFLIASLFILRAAVTRPDSGVHGSESNLIFAGISNFSRRAAFPACSIRKQGINKENFPS